jgi:UDP-glucuronate 4-epimerase
VDEFNDFYDPAIKRRNLESVKDRVTVVEGDLRDRAMVEGLFEKPGFTSVIHLAARAGVRPSIADPRLYFSTNVDGTFNLLEACRANGVKHFVFASSSSVYGSRQRPDLAIAKFTDAILNGRQIDRCGDGSTARDYTFVDDIVAGVMAAFHCADTDFEIFNLGGSATTTLSELIEIIEAATGKATEIRQLPDQPGDVPRTYADVSKSAAMLGYAPKVPIREGIRKYVEWRKNNFPTVR